MKPEYCSDLDSSRRRNHEAAIERFRGGAGSGLPPHFPERELEIVRPANPRRRAGPGTTSEERLEGRLIDGDQAFTIAPVEVRRMDQRDQLGDALSQTLLGSQIANQLGRLSDQDEGLPIPRIVTGGLESVAQRRKPPLRDRLERRLERR
jgi:hypothetical protein